MVGQRLRDRPAINECRLHIATRVGQQARVLHRSGCFGHLQRRSELLQVGGGVIGDEGVVEAIADGHFDRRGREGFEQDDGGGNDQRHREHEHELLGHQLFDGGQFVFDDQLEVGERIHAFGILSD